MSIYTHPPINSFLTDKQLNMGGKMKDMTEEQKGLHKQLRERLLKLELSEREKKDVMNDLTIWRFVSFEINPKILLWLRMGH
jgi:hypothetical protein